MSERRYSNGKNSYQPNRYKAELNHQRAMRAGSSDDKTYFKRNDDGYFISSKRLYKDNVSVENVKQQNIYNDVDHIDVNKKSYINKGYKNRYAHSYSKQNRSQKYKKNVSRYKKSNIINGRIVVLTVAILLILAVVIFTVVEIINSFDNNTQTVLLQTQSTSSETLSSNQNTNQMSAQKTTYQ